MTHSQHSQHPQHSQHAHHPHHPEKRPVWLGLHKDWRAWLALALMLAAIGIYVLTLDDSLQPGGGAASGRPAATAPAAPPQ